MSGPGPDAAVARRTFRRLLVGAAVVGAVFALTTASSALSYVSTFPTQADRDQVAATTGGDAGLAVLLGPVAHVDTVGGYTFYKGYVFLTAIGAVWALLAGTRQLRGEEDGGRWQVVLAGSTTPARATAATAAGLLGAVGVVLVLSVAGTAAAGLDHDVGFSLGGSVVMGLSLALVAAWFAALGALTSQLARSRRTANQLGLAVLAVAFALRMVADAGPSTAWLRWWTPFGWSELMAPLTTDDLWPLVPAVVTTALLVVVAVRAAAARDVGDGLLASRDVHPPRTRWLGSAAGLAARLELGVLAWWAVGSLAAGAMLGVIAKLTERSVPASLGDALSGFGVSGRFVDQYFGVSFLLVATLVALVPASQVGAAAEEELTGRLVHVLASPTRRTGWLASRLVLAAAGVVVAGLAAGFGAWAGARSHGVPLDLGPMLGAGLNVVPTALVALGIGALVLAVHPRWAGTVVYVVVGWSVVVDLAGSLVDGIGWLRHVSLFDAMALAPAEDPSAATVGITLAVAAVLCVAAVAWFDRRDLGTG